MARYRRATHVIFDLDGTLIDTETMNKQIMIDIGLMFDKEYTDEVRDKLSGKTEAESIGIFLKELEIPLTLEEAKKLINEKEKENIPKIKLMPGAEKLVCHLAENNIPLAIASNSTYEAIEFKLANFKHIRNALHHITSGDGDPEIKHGKPAPDVYITAASRFPDHPKPEQCLVFEDTGTGVFAALSAGMQVVMIPDHKIDPEKTKNATLVLKSMCDFKPECFCLPPFCK